MISLLTTPAFDHVKAAELLRAFPPLPTYAPPRLVPLCLVARDVMASMPPEPKGEGVYALIDAMRREHALQQPEFINGQHKAAINAPRHIITGSLRRGWLGSVAMMVLQAERDAEERLIAGRSEVWKRLRVVRPAVVTAEEWDGAIAAHMRLAVEPQAVVEALATWCEGQGPAGLEWAGRGGWEAFLAASEGWDAPAPDVVVGTDPGAPEGDWGATVEAQQ